MMGYTNMAEWISDNPLGAAHIAQIDEDSPVEIIITKPNSEGIAKLNAAGFPIHEGALIIEAGVNLWIANPDENGEPQVFIT